MEITKTEVVFTTVINDEEDSVVYLLRDDTSMEELRAKALYMFQYRADRKNGFTMLDRMCRDAPELAEIRAKAEAEGHVFITLEDPRGVATFHKYLRANP